MASDDGWVPAWVATLGVPVWITDPRGKISYFNKRAEKLLGCSAAEAVGTHCHRVIRGCTTDGLPHCGPRCPLLERAQRAREIEPIHLRVRGHGGRERLVQVLVTAVRRHESRGLWLVHCALADERAERIESYLRRVMARSPRTRPRRGSKRHPALTAREHEVLRLLAEDESLHSIAMNLGVTHITVRKHVQHILAKLGAHSIMEAVAYYLVEGERGVS